MVLMNPTLAEVEKLFNQTKLFLRVIEDMNGDIYVWKGEKADHGQMVERLSLHPKAKNRGLLHTVEEIRECGLFRS